VQVEEEAALQQQVERNYRWNFLVNTLDGATFGLGMSFFSSEILLPLFVSHFTNNPLAIGLIAFLGWGGVLVPQIFTANAVERAAVKKFFPVTLGFFLERLPILLLAPVVFLLATRQPVLTLALFFLLYTWHNTGAGIIVVGWQDMIAKVIPVEKRGRFFGISNFLGNGTGILGALAVPFVLGRLAFPAGFATCFAIAGGLLLVSWMCMALTREPPVPSSKPPVRQLDYLRALPEALRRDHNFRMYLLALVVSSLGGMAAGFLTVHAAQKWNLPDSAASGFMIALQAGLTLANLFFGLLADRRGHKLILEACWLLHAAYLLLAFLAPGPGWFFAIFFLSGCVAAGNHISCISIVFEFTEAENRPTYIGLANTIPGIVIALAPLLGGWLAGWMGYPVMFLLAGACAAAGWGLLRFGVREPREAARGNPSPDEKPHLERGG
jgi:MFS family permease